MTIHDTIKLCCHSITDVDAVIDELQRIPEQLRVRVRPPGQALVLPPSRTADRAQPHRGESAPPLAFRPRFR